MKPSRGLPDESKRLEKVGQKLSDPTVFETYKADWETFQRKGNTAVPPSDWNSRDALLTSANGPCAMAGPGDFLLAPVSKYGSNNNIKQFGLGVGTATVLVAQNGKYVRYLAAYNEKLFNHIRGNEGDRSSQLFLYDNVHDKMITFPDNSIAVKSSWIDMTNIPHSERFHRRVAWLEDPNSNTCTKTVVGLVGLHIVQKTRTKREWIWATFEHVDNVPPTGYVRPSVPSKPTRTFTFHDGTNAPMPSMPPDAYFFDAANSAGSPPPRVNIGRLLPINSDTDVTRNTAETNVLWQTALRAQNSVWQYYQLVMTQWPGANFDPPGTSAAPGLTTPGLPDNHSAFSNTTMETWPQRDIHRGCMSCHDIVHDNDFVWSLEMNAFQDQKPSVEGRPAIEKLKSLLRRGPQ